MAIINVHLAGLALSLGYFFLVRGIIIRARRNPRRLPLPPGPKGLPLLGNTFEFPQEVVWEGYDKLCKEYGDIIYLQPPIGPGVIILGSQKRAIDLLEKKSLNFSDRPVLPINEMMDMGWSFGAMPYGVVWRKDRGAFHQHLNAHAVPQYHPIVLEEIFNFLRKLKSDPDQLFDGLHCLFGTVIMRIAYGFDDVEKNKTLIHTSETLVLEHSKAAVPGRYLVNYFPFLNKIDLPSWVPGAGFKKKFQAMNYKVIHPPFEEVIREVEEGWQRNHPSIAQSLIDRLPEEGNPARAAPEEIARRVCAIAYIAGSETTISSSMAMLYALANNPEIQAKAQAEIDSVIGWDRLPTIQDREEMPYVQAIIKEVLRWHTVAPVSVPHCSAEDDEYDGYFIPKGTAIFPNSWAILHDPEVFHKPFDFIPERYLGKDGKLNPSAPDPEIAAFGHGRRICPGRHFTKDAQFLMISSLLATYTLIAAKDEQEKVIPMKLDLTNPILNKPLPFKCEVRLRPGREHLLQ